MNLSFGILKNQLTARLASNLVRIELDQMFLQLNFLIICDACMWRYEVKVRDYETAPSIVTAETIVMTLWKQVLQT